MNENKRIRDCDFPAHASISSFLAKHLPGETAAIRSLREEIIAFCFDLSARVLMLVGPVGAGKTTIARMIGLLKAIAPLSGQEAERYLENAKFVAPGLLDLRPMHWYVELPLPGLVETLAETQLFGIGKGRASTVAAKAGVFETAMTGHGGNEDSTEVRTTGGVVFLDEIADLPKVMQPKLLSILAGDTFYRVGDEETVLSFTGTTIVATWQNPRKHLRADLFSRLADRIVEVPGLSGRTADLEHIIRSIESQLIDKFRARIEFLSRDEAVSRLWLKRAANLDHLADEVVTRLASIGWERYGNMRGLASAVKALVFGEKDFKHVISGLTETTGEMEVEADHGNYSIIEELLQRKANGAGLAGHVKEIELQRRSYLRHMLMTDERICQKLADHLRLEPSKLSYQLQQLDRTRRRRRIGGQQ